MHFTLYENTTLRKLHAATRYIRHRVNMTHDDYRKEQDAKTAIVIVARHTASQK